jgi:hypothetical protein
MSPAVITCLGELFAVRSFLAHRAGHRRLFFGSAPTVSR